MKRQIVKNFITVKKVRYLPRETPPPPPPPKRRILVVGRCTLAMVTVCNAFPEPGEVERTQEGSWRRAGGASNICTVLRRLCVDCEFLGQLSSAASFESLIFSFQGMGIDISNCPRGPQDPPHQSIIVVRAKGTYTTVDHSSACHELTFQQFLGAVDFQKYNWIHFEARNSKETLRMMTAVHDYNKRCDDHIVISMDLPNLRKLNLYMASLADYAFIAKQVQTVNAYMNGHETVWRVRDLLNQAHDSWELQKPKKMPDMSVEGQPIDPMTCRPSEWRKPVVIFANYIEGASCLLADDTYFKVEGHIPLQVVDTIGEHDTFCGAVIYALNEAKMRITDALDYGTRVTSAKVTKEGFDGLRCIPKDLMGFICKDFMGFIGTEGNKNNVV